LDFLRAAFGLFRGLVDSPLGGCPEGQISPGRLDVLQEGTLKGLGAGCPCQRASLADERALSGIQVKKEKERATQEDYKDVVRLCK